VGWAKLAVFFHNKGCEYYDRNLYDEAIAYFKKSLIINSEVAVTHYNLANAYMEIKKEDEAIEEYKKTIQIAPSYIQAYCALSQIYRSRQMYEEALIQLKQAEIAIPSNQEIKKFLGEISFEYMTDCLDRGTESFLAGDKQKAYVLLNKALKINPGFAFTHYTLAYFYFTDHNYNEAEAGLNKTIELNSQFWSAHKLLGDIYFEKGDYENAINEYKRALTLNYNDPALNNDLGLVLMQMERYDEALVYLKEAIKLDPDNLNIRYSLASVYRDNEMISEAIEEYKKVIRYQPDYPNVHNDLGDIYRRLGKDKESLEEYKKEIEYCQAKLAINPNDPIMLNNLAYALNGIGENNKAKEIIDKLIDSQPNYRQAYLTLAKINEKLGNFNKIIATLEKAKGLSVQTNFIDRDIDRVKKELRSSGSGFMAVDTIYLKNGRQIKGRIKEEDEEKVIIEVQLGNVIGSLTFYRNMIERIIKSSSGNNTKLYD